jgi:hypothetical protein
MKKIFFLVSLLIITCTGFSQQPVHEIYLDSLYTIAPQLLSVKDQSILQEMPEFTMAAEQRTTTIPSFVDNSQTYYFPYIFYQSALECGQASTLTYLFTYELAVRRNRFVLFDTPINKYHIPSHFAWNFCNGGASSGVSAMDTWQVIKTAGSPFTPDWGTSYADGGASKWISGYEKYYHGMQNRIVDMYAIPTNTEEGINTLKHWIANHCTGEGQGGLAHFYCTYQGTNGTLPTGTPEGGKAVMTTFSSYVNHSQTIVGYNDSIRYDYNGDGLYTNNIDINNDGVVNVKDWEIGGVIFCNSFGTAWGNNGFAYLPYKKLAETHTENGGIWNACVYIVNLRDEVFPQITYKATIKHDKRNMIRLTAGISTDLNATTPSTTIGFNIFNYQGGELYMQGGTTEADKTLELGLDVTPLLNSMEPGLPYKFFLGVTENDVSGTGTGQILNFSVMDYTGTTPIEIPCNTINAPILNNSTTYLGIEHTLDFSKPVIQTDTISVNAFETFAEQLDADYGLPPYRWELSHEYGLDEFTAPYPTNEGTSVTLSSTDNGYAIIPLPFSFPCFESTYNQIAVFADGYIAFRYDTYNWPFLKDADNQLKTSRFIGPFRGDLVVTSLKKISDANSITISYTANIKSQSANTVHFTVKLYASGVIEYYYGDMSYTGANFISVLSRGDAIIFHKTAASGLTAANCANRNFRYTPPPSIAGLSLSRTGELSGRIEAAMDHVPVAITCCDNNEVRTSKILYFSSLYSSPLLITNVLVNSNGNSTVTAGDTVLLSITIKNVDTLGFDGCNLKFSIIDEYITLLDSTEYFGYIAGGNEYVLNNSIKFVVDSNIPNNYNAEFNTIITTSSNVNSEGVQNFIIKGRDVDVMDFTLVSGNNNIFDPGETAQFSVLAKNTGASDINNLRFALHFAEPELTPTVSQFNISTLAIDATTTLPFEISVSNSYISGTTVDALIDVYVNNNFFKTIIVTLVGVSNCDGFETGFPAPITFSDTAWVISNTIMAGGLQSAASGVVTHYQQSSMFLQKDILVAGDVTFQRKVSSESTYDFLNFYIDGTKMGSWSGEMDWALATYPVTVGSHLFQWQYKKDLSVDTGSDKAWVDDICFPSDNTAIPNLIVNPETVYVEIPKELTLDSTVTLTSSTPIYAIFTNAILDTLNNPVNWCVTNYPNGSVNALQSKEITLSFNTRNKIVGQVYEASLVTTVTDGNQVITPVHMKVVSGVGVSEFSTENQSSVYPNPTKDIVTISNSKQLIQSVQLFDVNGKLLVSQFVNQNLVDLNLSAMSSGIYFVKIMTENQSVQNVKVIKN